LSCQLDDQDGHERNVDRHQEHTAPDGQSQMSTFAAKISHGRCGSREDLMRLVAALVSSLRPGVPDGQLCLRIVSDPALRKTLTVH
jgi:hypothetical protein